MVDTGWTPSPEELRSGQEAYLRYLGGVAILQNPTSDFAKEEHKVERVSDETSELVIVTAERLIYSGARQALKQSNPLGQRTNKDMEMNFEGALPNIWRIVDTTFEDWAGRVELTGVALNVLRPAPFAVEKVYHHVARSRKEKLYTLIMMGGLTPASVLASTLENRTLDGQVKRRRVA